MSGCVLWTGRVVTGSRGSAYGGVWLDGKTYHAHRVFFMLYNGPIPRGHVVHHTCENKLCVNPAHLVAITQSEHIHLHGAYRASSAAKVARTHCKRGHEFTPENTWVRKNRGPERHCRACNRLRQAA